MAIYAKEKQENLVTANISGFGVNNSLEMSNYTTVGKMVPRGLEVD